MSEYRRRNPWQRILTHHALSWLWLRRAQPHGAESSRCVEFGWFRRFSSKTTSVSETTPAPESRKHLQSVIRWWYIGKGICVCEREKVPWERRYQALGRGQRSFCQQRRSWCSIPEASDKLPLPFHSLLALSKLLFFPFSLLCFLFFNDPNLYPSNPTNIFFV